MVKQMFFTMRRELGVGLAAPQVGETNTTCSRGDQEDENPPACSTAWPDGRRESEDYICFKKDS